MLPCGANASGTVVEFFVHPEDAEEMLRDGVTLNDHGSRARYRCRLTSTPHYSNGDVQVQMLKEAA